MSVRWRLTVWLAVTLILTVLAIFLTLRFSLQNVLESHLDSQLNDDFRQVSAEIIRAGSIDDADLNQIVGFASFVLVIRDLDGDLLAATPGIDLTGFALDGPTLALIADGESTRDTVTVGDEDYRVRASRLIVGRDEQGGPRVVAVAQVAESAAAVQEVMRILQIVLISVGAIAAVLAIAAGFWLGRSTVKPIEDVVRVAREIEASDLTRRLNLTGKPSEVQRLADTFDAMIERLNLAFQQQRNFVLDVSHELRTPLTALRGNIDVLLMDDALDREMREQLQRMSQEVGRLVRLTSNMLYLAHADAGRDLDRRPVELDSLCVEVVRQARDLKRTVGLRVDVEDTATVMGDRDLLKQLLLNLVDNGLKYTPDGGEVTVSLHADDGWGRIAVSDTGHGMSQDEMTHIFDRYYRGAGSGGRKGSGAGIGLAISQWIATSHGGNITVESEEGQGSVFTVSLPLAGDGGAAGQDR